MELDARRLRVLHTVALRGSVTAAAASLHISPSAISQQLAQLEREAGCDLVERAGRGIRLTPAGQALAAHAEQVLHALDRAAAAVAAARTGVAGTVWVGTFPSAGVFVAPAAVRAQQRHPALDVRVTEAEDEASLLDLRLTALDVVVMQEYDHVPVTLPPGVTAQTVAHDPLYLVTPATGPLAGRAPLSDLRDAPWIAPGPDTPCGRATRQACRDAGFEPDIRHTALDFALILDMVAAGLGVALIPALGLRTLPTGVRAAPTCVPALKRTIFAVTRTVGVGQQRPAVAALLTELGRVS
ncbi:LysR family transcriptional regulator [Planosporangium sp. 12N6]|uniref:LysR family transcriptional regulator n=1 Tax=Planosporangium spinosum TaxID=3402278 RepID=UPI003CEE6A4B